MPRAYDPNRVDQTADVRAGWRNSDPAFDASALEIDRAIAQLPAELKRAVMAAYRWEGGMQEIAAALGCTRATLHNRLCNADRRVRDWLDARHRRAGQIKARGIFATYT
ncbi:sigma factor-like helix-turn-helix DNA-binding protein [Achromobacter spanius]